MSLAHLYDGRFNRERQLKPYTMGAYLYLQRTYLAENEEAARRQNDEELTELCWANPGLDISDRMSF